MKKIAIIGAGPAGIFTALFLRNCKNLQIDLYEKNERIGKKLGVTGGGRMNIANKNFALQCFYSHQKNYLKNIFKSPYASDVLSFFEEFGIKYKWEGERALLVSGNAQAEVLRLAKMLEKQENLKVLLNKEIEKVALKDGKYLIDDQLYDCLVISCGGVVSVGGENSRPYGLALQLGHKVTDVEPALCGLSVQNNPFVDLAGVSLKCALKNAESSVCGDLIFTHKGVSGPAVLDFSLFYDGGPFSVDFLPDVDEDDFRKELESARKGKIFMRNFLTKFFPRRFVFWQMKRSGIDDERIVADLKKEEFRVLMKNIYNFEVASAKKSDFTSCWTSKGGVALDQVNSGSLESKIHKHLFFGGEVLDVTGLCGGFNISFAMLSAKIISDAIKKLC